MRRPVDLGVDAAVGELPRELLLDLGDQVALRSLQAHRSRSRHDRIGFRIELAERQILELLAHLLHAHAAGERRIDVERLLGDAPARARAACGASVRMLCRRSASLTSSTRTSSAIASSSLRRFSACLASLVTRSSFLQLGQALDQRADLLAEQLVDLGAGRLGILDGVVQQRGDDGGVVELEIGQDRRDFERMREIGIAGGALLLAMRLHGVDIGAVEQGLVGSPDCSA